jgi:hypothetical protein
MRAFAFLTDTISIWAVRKISREWETTKKAIEAKTLFPTFTLCQECELILRWSLPCRHHLAQAYITGQPIPRSLVHPRWWINGPVITEAGWAPLYFTTTLPLSPSRHPYANGRRNDITSTSLEILDARETLADHAKAQFDDTVIRAHHGLMTLVEDMREYAQLPINMPQKVNQSGWARGAKSHEKTTKRLLTGAEAAVKDADKAEQA